MAQLQPRLTLLDLPLEIRLKIWKIAVQDSQPEELNVCNHANGSNDPVSQLDFSGQPSFVPSMSRIEDTG